MDFFSNSSSNIDLREELHAILFGRGGVVPQGRQFILRKMSDTKCVCWSPENGGCGRPACKYCQGEGYLFSEALVTMFLITGAAPVYKPGFLGNGQYPQASYGYTDPNRATAFCEYSVFPDYERYRLQSKPNYDKLYEVKVNDDGTTYYPLTRSAKWKLLNLTPFHGDFGRIEFFELSLEKENVA